MTTTSHSSTGFTLLETLVALAVFALLLIWFSTGITHSWRGVSAAEADKRALALAQALIEEAGITSPLTPGTRKGTASDGLAWRVTIVPYRAQGAETSGDTSKAIWVHVTVAPRTATGSARRPLTLTTLKLARGP